MVHALWPLIILLALVPCLVTTEINRRWRHWSRDRWLVGLAWALLAIAGSHEPMFLPLGVSLLLRWTDWQAFATIVSWAAIVGLWFLARALPPPDRVTITHVWVGVGAVAAGLVIAHAGIRAASWVLPLPAWLDRLGRTNWYAAWFGQRTHAAAFLALILPLAPWPWVGGLLVLALVLGACWTAWLAAAAGLILLYPPVAWILLVLFVLAAWDVLTAGVARYLEAGYVRQGVLELYSVRGDSVKSILVRLRSWYGLARIWRSAWVTGAGLDQTRHYIPLGMARRPTWKPLIGAAHNDPVELVFEHGLLGLLALGAFAWRLAPALQLGDPASAAVVAGVILSLGTFFMQMPQVGVPWFVLCAWIAA